MSVIEEMTVNPLVQSLGWTLLQRVARNSYRCGLRRRERRAARRTVSSRMRHLA